MSGGNDNTNRPVTITLNVRAEALYNAVPQPANQTELDTYCSLSPGQIIPSGGTLQDFTTNVYSGNTVTWIGRSSDAANYGVLINSISNNPNFFASDPPGSSGQVTATLKTDIDGVGDTYSIGFTINPPGNPATFPPKPYTLDPKLRGNP